MNRKSILSVIFSIIICITITSSAFAREIYYNGTTPIVLKWNTKSGSKLYLTCSNDYFTGGPVYTYYAAGIAIWPTACPTTVSTVDTPEASAKVDFIRPTESYWEGIWGTPFDQYISNGGITFAYADIYDTNGLYINGLNAAMNSTKRIGVASIFVSPFADAWDGSYVAVPSADRKKAILAHELGHVMGMGHSDVNPYATASASIMKSDTFSMSTSPQTYDKNEVSNHIP